MAREHGKVMEKVHGKERGCGQSRSLAFRREGCTQARQTPAENGANCIPEKMGPVLVGRLAGT